MTHRRYSCLRAAGVQLAALIFLLVASGCATTTTAQQNAFNGLKTIRVGVEATLGIFNAGYQAGTYSEAQRTQLKGLYEKYLAADTIAANTLKATTTTDPGTIISQVTVVAADVIRFIQSLKATP